MKDNWNVWATKTSSFRRNSLTRGAAVGALLFLSACTIFSSAEDIERTVSGKAPVTFENLRARDPQSKLGGREHPKIVKANGGEYQNSELEKVLALIAGDLVTHSNDPDRAYDLTILDSPKVNAFALPGGYLYITRGLLALANDASEVAAVIAHEMAHISSNHGVERRKQTDANVLAGEVVDSVLTNETTGKVVKASSRQRLAAFSQQQELQADAVGIKLIGKAGFDPFAGARFLKSMQRYADWKSSLNSTEPALFSSHPSNPKRIALAQRHARLVGPPGTGERRRDRYLKSIDGMIWGDSAKEGYIRGNRFLHSGLGITFSVPPSFNLNNRAEAVLASGPNQTAIRFDGAQVSGRSDPVAYIKSGWVNGLLPASVKSETINGLPAAFGEAQTKDWNFSIAVIAFKKRYYRFIMASPRNQALETNTLRQTARSFRQLSSREIASLKPLRIKLVKVGRRDTLASLAGKMKGVSRKVDLFRTLNGLDAGQRPKAGSLVKVIVD